MNVSTITEFCLRTAAEKKKMAPVKLLADNELIGFFVQPEDVLVISDLNLGAQKRLRAMERFFRGSAGLKDVRLDDEE